MISPPILRRRYVFSGVLALETGLHVGGSWTIGSPSDSPVIRTPDGLPYIPGSSFKGAFRSTVEKLAGATGLDSCALLQDANCIGAQSKAQRDFELYWRDRDRTSQEFLADLDRKLCPTCKLFGSPYMASHIYFADLLPPAGDELAASMIQVRDGVAIDRDSERAVPRLKYDYEVVATAQTFVVNIALENPSDCDLALACLGLSEFVSGQARLGGKRSRGLGACKLEEVKVYSLDLAAGTPEQRAATLKRYLLGTKLEDKYRVEADATRFMQDKIGTLPIFGGKSC